MQLARGRRPSGSGDHIGVRRCRRRPGYGPPWTVRWPLRRCGSPAGILQVTDTVGRLVGVSGIDGPTGFDLRCQIREALVSYLQREHPEALPWSNRRGSPTPPSDAVPNHSDPVPCCPWSRGRVLRNPRTRPGDGPDPLAANGIDEPGLGWVARRSQPTSPRSARPRFDLKYGKGRPRA